MSQKFICIIQARTGSKRLPGKVLLKAGGMALLEYEIKRVKQVKSINKIVVATTIAKADDKIFSLCKRLKFDCFRGSEDDVLDRYYRCALNYPDYENIIRITGDCPLIDPKIISRLIIFYKKGNYDYASNVLKETYPDGLDAEVFKRKILIEAARKAKLLSEREHVTLYMRNNPKIKKGSLENKIDLSAFRLTVDNPEDFKVIKFLISQSWINDGFSHYIKLLKEHPEVMALNKKILRNEGLKKSLANDSAIDQ